MKIIIVLNKILNKKYICLKNVPKVLYFFFKKNLASPSLGR